MWIRLRENMESKSEWRQIGNQTRCLIYIWAIAGILFQTSDIYSQNFTLSRWIKRFHSFLFFSIQFFLLFILSGFPYWIRCCYCCYRRIDEPILFTVAQLNWYFSRNLKHTHSHEKNKNEFPVAMNKTKEEEVEKKNAVKLV